MAYERSESTRDSFGKFNHQFQPETKTLIKKLERILIKLYRQNVSLLCNQTCLNERPLPNYAHTHTHTHTHIYLYILNYALITLAVYDMTRGWFNVIFIARKKKPPGRWLFPLLKDIGHHLKASRYMFSAWGTQHRFLAIHTTACQMPFCWILLTFSLHERLKKWFLSLILRPVKPS